MQAEAEEENGGGSQRANGLKMSAERGGALFLMFAAECGSQHVVLSYKKQ